MTGWREGGVTRVPGDGRERALRPPPSPPSERPLMVLLAAGLVLAAETGTQYVAWRFAFHPALGSPLVVLSDHAVRLWRAASVLALGSAVCALLLVPLRRLSGPLLLVAVCATIGSLGPIYPPYQIFLWYARAARVHAALAVFWGGWVLVALVGLTTVFVITSAHSAAASRGSRPTRTGPPGGEAGRPSTARRGSCSAASRGASSAGRAKGISSRSRPPDRAKASARSSRTSSTTPARSS